MLLVVNAQGIMLTLCRRDYAMYSYQSSDGSKSQYATSLTSSFTGVAASAIASLRAFSKALVEVSSTASHRLRTKLSTEKR